MRSFKSVVAAIAVFIVAVVGIIIYNQGFGYLQFIPCLRPMGDDTESELYMTPKQYSDFLIRIFNLYVKDFARGNYISIRQFDNWVRMYLGEKAEQCGLMGHCTHQFVVEGNGNVYPCDFYCTDEWCLGNLSDMTLEEMAKSKTAFDRIQFVGSEIAKCSEWYAKKMQRDKTARREYLSVERNRRVRGDLYITQIIDEEMTSDDARLR